MFRAETALVFTASAPRRGRASIRSSLRRDPRRFGRAAAWLAEDAADDADIASNDLRLFAHSFAGFFLFFSLLIA
jgi:hypothetical protein